MTPIHFFRSHRSHEQWRLTSSIRKGGLLMDIIKDGPRTGKWPPSHSYANLLSGAWLHTGAICFRVMWPRHVTYSVTYRMQRSSSSSSLVADHSFSPYTATYWTTTQEFVTRTLTRTRTLANHTLNHTNKFKEKTKLTKQNKQNKTN